MDELIGVVLAGGRSSRFNQGNKIFAKIGKETLIQRALRRAGTQVDKLILSVNSDIADQLNFRIPMITDSNFHSAGPLGGILSTLEWISENYGSDKNVVYFPVDVPFFPNNVVSVLLNMKNENISKKLFTVSYEGRVQPLFSLWDISLKVPLNKYLKKNNYKVESFFKENSCIIKELQKINPYSFLNINTIHDLKKINSLLLS